MRLGSVLTECSSGEEYRAPIWIWLKDTRSFPWDLLASVMKTIAPKQPLWVAPVCWPDVLKLQRAVLSS